MCDKHALSNYLRKVLHSSLFLRTSPGATATLQARTHVTALLPHRSSCMSPPHSRTRTRLVTELSCASHPRHQVHSAIVWRPSPFKTSGDVELWRTSLRALGIKLAVISVCSLACKAVMVALKLFCVVPNCSSLHLSMSTPLVQALPSLLTIALLVPLYSGSVAAARGSHAHA